MAGLASRIIPKLDTTDCFTQQTDIPDRSTPFPAMASSCSSSSCSSSSSSIGDKQLQRIIKDLYDAVLELSKEHREGSEPITDDSTNLHKFFYKLEYLLQFDQKEKTTFLGQRKDYWDYFCQCLIKIKGANDGIRFVKSIPELKTSLGKGRAFVRYSLVHQRLADTLQQCLINQKVTSEWYYARSPLLRPPLTADIINHLYELNQIQFDVAARGYDLDADWPSFARRTLGSGSFLWKAPTRCSSTSSLTSSYSQVQEFHPISDFNQSLLGELGELAEASPCSAAEDLRIELDQSELRQQELLRRVQELGKEASQLRGVVQDLRGQLSAQSLVSSDPEAEDEERINVSFRDPISSALHDRLAIAESRNMELLSKLEEALKEKGEQAASYHDSSWKVEKLLEKLKMAEEEKSEAKREAGEKVRQSERLSQELRLREEELRGSREKLAQVQAGAEEERAAGLARLEELQSAVGRIQGALTVKEKETGNLRAQLQGLQASLEGRERQAEDLRRRLQGEREEEAQGLESLVVELKKSLKHKDMEVSASSERIKDLEEQLEELKVHKERLNSHDEAPALRQSRSLPDAARKSEASVRELTENSAAPLEQLASARAAEKQFRSRMESANVSLDEREKKLLDEKRHLEEDVQKSVLQKKELEARFHFLQLQNEQLLESQAVLRKQMVGAQQELDALNTKTHKMTKDRAELLEKLQETEARLQEQADRCEELRRSAGDAHDEKGAAESNEKSPSAEVPLKLVMAEAQLQLHLREASRLREEAVQLRAQLLTAAEERIKVQALQEVTEASREDLRVLAEQLKAQVEELNRRHVDEILRSREREDALIRERDCEARARVGLAAEVTARAEELEGVKGRYEAACVENGELSDALHRANTETAELGVHVCMLTAENEEARLRWEGLSARLQELEEEATHEAERLRVRMDNLQEEKQELHRQLQDKEEEKQELHRQLQDKEEEKQEEEKQEEEKQEEETASRQREEQQNQLLLQTVTLELEEVRLQLRTEQETARRGGDALTQLQAENQKHLQQIEKKTLQMAKSENLLRQKAEELIHLKENLSRCEQALAVAEKAHQDLTENLRRVTQDKHRVDMTSAAELDDLYRTKINLEERLVELIREKDVLWQKSDALEFQQKLREEETQRDVNHCLGCHSQFSWWLRKYTCRLCGRPFCYYCCSNTVSTQGGSREHCCSNCYEQHSAVVERHPQEEEVNNSLLATPFSRLLQAGRAASTFLGAEEGRDDVVFDIITEEELFGVHDTEGLSLTTDCSPGNGQQGAPQLPSGGSAAELQSEDPEDVKTPVQDAEICLLKCGELTLSSNFTLEEISAFGDGTRELFIKSSCYSIISISISSAGPNVCWTFTSEPKSISFSVVFRENAHTPLEHAKVLIPLTRWNAHRETVQGALKVRNPGEYTLIFDNSFSRFISKKVLYRLSLDKSVVYDGTDLL